MERMRLHLIREWIRNGIEVDLVVSRFAGPLTELVPDAVPVFELAPKHPLQFPFGLLRYLRRRKPTHILSAGTDTNALTMLVVSMFRIRTPTIFSMHIQQQRDLELSKGLLRAKTRIAMWILQHTVRHSRAVIAVSRGVADDLKSWLPLRSGQVHVIYNPAITSETEQMMRAPLSGCPVPADTPWILYAGRLVQTKGLDILLDAFNLVADQTTSHLILMGEGPLRSHLKRTIKSHKHRGRIHMIGFQDNPLPWMREASVFVLPSRNEGLPNVLIEAMACGTQVVATDCPSGPIEILAGGRYGQLVPVGSPDALASALLRSLAGQFHVPTGLLREHAAEFSSVRAAALYEAVVTGMT